MLFRTAEPNTSDTPSIRIPADKKLERLRRGGPLGRPGSGAVRRGPASGAYRRCRGHRTAPCRRSCGRAGGRCAGLAACGTRRHAPGGHAGRAGRPCRRLHGDAAREPARLADEHQADAPLLGAPEHRQHHLIGSVPMWMARHAHCPVVIVP
ncbi:universal stress protein [Streptomyces shenzhenensis]|uniref:universal stress protein n=1 Tax=Streptomyces shenzhenensis TaxID=943815 RepID=UPI0038D4B8AA